jgi:hypothetical protein
MTHKESLIVHLVIDLREQIGFNLVNFAAYTFNVSIKWGD